MENGAETFRDKYRDVEAKLQTRIPHHRDRAVEISLFVDTYQDCDKLTSKLHTGCVTFWKCALLIWYRKRNNTVKSSMLSNEFIGMKSNTKGIIALT